MTALRWASSLSGGLFVAVMVIAATASLDHVFSDAWLPGVAFPTVIALIVAEVVRGLGGRLWLPVLAGAAAGAVTAVRTWWSGTLAGDLIPTRDTVSALLADLERTQHTVRVEQSPIEPHLHVLAILSLVVLLIALIVELIALGLRSPAVAGVPALGIIAAGAVLSGEMTPLPALLLAAAAWLGLLVAGDHASLHRSVSSPASRGQPEDTGAPLGPLPPRPPLRDRLTSLTGAVLAGVTALAVLAMGATQLAPITTGLAPEGHRFLIQDGPVDPASDLGEALRQGSGPVGIEYRSSTGLGVYLRTAVIHDVTASQWVPRETAGGMPPNGTVFTPSGRNLRGMGPTVGIQYPPELEEAVMRPSEQSVDLALTQYRGSWLPLADQPVGQAGVLAEQGWESYPRASTVQRISNPAVDAQYRSRYWTLPLSAEELSELSAGFGIPPPEAYIGLEAPDESAVGTLVSDPELEGGEIHRLAQEIAAEATSPIEIGQLVQEHFQSGTYRYSETAPVDEGYDGTGIEITEQFLQAQSGYCIHFASAMALMARSLDVPARIVVGYAPTGADADGVHRVEAGSAHAWPELYIYGLGWVPFEPTPTVGRAPTYTQSDSGPAPEVVPTPTSAPAPASEPTPTQTSAALDPGSDAGDTPEPGVDTRAVLTVLIIVIGVAAVALLALAPHLVRSRRRRRRLGRPASPFAVDRSAVIASWQEVEDTALDLGWARHGHESEEAFARRVSRDVGSAMGPGSQTDLLHQLAVAAQWARYASVDSPAPPAADDASSHAAAVVDLLESSAESAARRRAWWLPRSLVQS
ncbi:transglutaminaseTgpA domain-containing protein [Micrococcus sp. IITD107]|uniref:transglutaminaseTgpA domain-containing protein n=1 Tax=Micrococcus sp. IITD107 TaxID=3342790 RepID=UPI0035BACED9